VDDHDWNGFKGDIMKPIQVVKEGSLVDKADAIGKAEERILNDYILRHKAIGDDENPTSEWADANNSHRAWFDDDDGWEIK
jgi:hypothetical protein